MFETLIGDEYLEPEIEEYINFMEEDEQDNVGFLSKKKVNENFNAIGEYLNNFIVYPDLFVDLIIPKASHFKLLFLQRVIMRCNARGNVTYSVFSRGTSKSFVADLERYLHCMFVPRHNTTITAGTNKQAAEIAKQKIVDDLWVKFPLLANEMQKRKIAGKILEPYIMGNDYVEFKFKNGSSLGLGNVRGLRKESLILEEIIEQDQTKVNEVYIPLLNRPRAMRNGLLNPHEPQSQQLYVTTAGYQGTFAYQKLIETLCRSILEPRKYYVLTGTYRLPLAAGLTSKKQIEDVINSPSFDKKSFEREYESIWSNAPAGAAFSTSLITQLRQVKKVELKNSLTDKMKEDGCFYAICADMAKDGSADTAVGVAKVIPKEHYFIYKFVNLFSIPTTDYLKIANVFKKTVLAYDAKLLIYDANGVGAGIRDWLNKTTTDETGMILDGLGIINPPTSAEKDIIKYPKSRTICYEIKSGGKVGEQIHFFFFSRMSTGAVTFPVKLNEALNLYSQNKSFMSMSMRRKEEFMFPFKTMDKMEEQLKNLDLVNTSDNMSNTLKIVRRDTAVQKDFFSMGEYLVWAVNQQIELAYYKKRKKHKEKRVLIYVD